MVGYITDPAAYKNEEYAATVVPKLIGLPPWKPDTGRQLTTGLLQLLGSMN